MILRVIAYFIYFYNILVKFMLNSYNVVKLSKSLLLSFHMSTIKFSFKLRDGSIKPV